MLEVPRLNAYGPVGPYSTSKRVRDDEQLFLMGSSLSKSHHHRNYWYEEAGQVTLTIDGRSGWKRSPIIKSAGSLRMREMRQRRQWAHGAARRYALSESSAGASRNTSPDQDRTCSSPWQRTRHSWAKMVFIAESFFL